MSTSDREDIDYITLLVKTPRCRGRRMDDDGRGAGRTADSRERWSPEVLNINHLNITASFQRCGMCPRLRNPRKSSV
jgi:hypothetical protein